MKNNNNLWLHGWVLTTSVLVNACVLQPTPIEATLNPNRTQTVMGDADHPAHLSVTFILDLDPIQAQPVLGDADHPAQLLATIQQEETDTAEITAIKVVKEEQKSIDLWDRIRSNFMLADYDHPRIQKEQDWFIRHQEYLDRVAIRALPYLYYIVETLEANGIPGEIALLPIVESAFQPFAYSPGRASGIWQFIPATGRHYGLKQNWWYDGRRDIYASTQASIKLLSQLNKEFKGDWLLALAAYNSGSKKVKRAIRRNRKRGKPTDFFSLDLPPETRGYVPKLLALKRIVNNPGAHNIELKEILDQPFFEKVNIGSQIDLALAAELADIDIEELYLLNPGFNRWATDPDGPHYLLLPSNKKENFIQQLNELAPDKRMRWIRHRIRRGETLSTIANKYHTTTRTIKRMNHIRGNLIREGKGLIIPVASRSPHNYKLSADQRKRKTQNIQRKGRKIFHIVRSGDTLWDLAMQHSVSVNQLAKWNDMAPRDTLKPGQRLVIWSRSGTNVLTFDPPTIDIPPRRKMTHRIGYRVRRGDSLARISQRFNVSIAQLRRWNNLPKNKYLQPGQRLTLYVDVIRQSGSS